MRRKIRIASFFTFISLIIAGLAIWLSFSKLDPYRNAVKNGFEGTYQEYLDSLKGQDGQNGTNGTNGTNGVNGQDGTDGTNGTNGVNGQDGADGLSILEITCNNLNSKLKDIDLDLNVSVSERMNAANITDKMLKGLNGNYLYSYTNNKFIGIDDAGFVVSPSSSYEKNIIIDNVSSLEDLWYFDAKKAADLSLEYSNFLTSEFISGGDTINIVTGLDVGEHNESLNISYDRHDATVGKEVVITTKKGVLTINAPKDVVKHLGEADQVNIIAVASSSYHEFGIVPIIDIKEGHIVLENESTVKVVHFAKSGEKDTFNADVFKDISIKVSSGVTLPLFTRDSIIINEQEGTKVAQVEVEDDKNFIWLFMEGIYEQTKVSTINDKNETIWTNTSDANEQTKAIASEIANNINGSKGNDYTITGEETASGSREIVPSGGITVEELIEETGKNTEQVVNIAKFEGGNGKINTPFLIKNEVQLLNLEGVISPNSGDVYFKFIGDADMSNPEIKDLKGYTWSRLRWFGNDVLAMRDDFMIHIDLDGHKIDNLDCFLFASIQNLEFKNGTVNFVDGEHESGIIYSPQRNVKMNIAFKDLTINGSDTANMAHFGPLVAQAWEGSGFDSDVLYAENVICNEKINNIGSNAYTGGLFGYVVASKGLYTVKNCEFNGSVQSSLAAGFINPMVASGTRTVVSEGNTFNGILLGTSKVAKFGANLNDEVATIGDNAQAVKIAVSETLVDKNAAMGSEIIVNHNDINIDHYVVSIMIWTNEGTCSSIFNNQVLASDAVDNKISTGLYKNYFKHSDVDNSTDANRQNSFWYHGCIYLSGDTYNVYSMSDCKVSEKANTRATINIYGYDADNVVKTYQSVQYICVK